MPEQAVAWGQRGDIGEKGAGTVIVKAMLEIGRPDAPVGPRRNAGGEQRLDLRGEQEIAVVKRVVERLDAELVAGAEQGLAVLVPDREGKHADEMLDAILTPFAPGGEDRLGIAAAPERIAGQLVLQLEIIVDFAVEGEPQRGHCRRSSAATRRC